MKKQILSFMLLTSSLWGLDKLDEKYLVLLGDASAPLHVTQYYSFTCPHCLALFQKDFQEIKKMYVETKNIPSCALRYADNSSYGMSKPSL
jgi:hypothetical protein